MYQYIIHRNDTKEFESNEIVHTEEWSPDKLPRKSNLRQSRRQSETDVQAVSNDSSNANGT